MFYTKKKLKFDVSAAEAKLIKPNIIEVNIIIDNRTKFDWPGLVLVKGKHKCKLTESISIEIPNLSVKAWSVKRIKFQYQINYNAYAVSKEPMEFILNCFDNFKGVKYYSKPVKVFLS